MSDIHFHKSILSEVETADELVSLKGGESLRVRQFPESGIAQPAPK